MQNLHNRKILLIGGAGYIGSVLSSYLLQHGYSVRVLDVLLYQHGHCTLPYFSNPHYEFFYGNFTCEKTIVKSLQDITDVIILAGLVGDPITKKYPALSNVINLHGMKRFIAHLSQYHLNKVIFISTCSNYGLMINNALADEQTELKPLSLYAQAKVEIEKFILSQRNIVNYCATILRFATAFGLSSRMRFDLSVNEFTRELYLGNELVVYDQKTWRPYCHVLDFALALKMVLEAPKESVFFEIFNAGSEKNNYTKQMIIDTVLRYIPTGKVYYQQFGSDPRNYRVNFQKIKNILGFEAQFSVQDGITEILTALQNKCFENSFFPSHFYGNYNIHEKYISIIKSIEHA